MLDKEIKELFGAVLQIDSDTLNDTTTPKDIAAWSSINHLNLIAVFEEKFAIDIEPEEIPLMAGNFGKFKEIIMQKLD
jgi:acyl carrier protein